MVIKLDYEIVSRALDRIGLKSSNKSLRKKQARLLIGAIEAETGEKYFTNIDKLEEIISKIR